MCVCVCGGGGGGEGGEAICMFVFGGEIPESSN